MRIRILALLLTVAGCGGDNMASTATVPPTTPTPETAMVTVGAAMMTSFDPQTVTIAPGGTVQWVWQGGPHTVTSGVPGAADGTFCSLPGNDTPSVSACSTTAYAAGAGNTYSHMFPTAGTFQYFCEVHGAMMTGTIVVSTSGGTGGGGGGGGSTGGTGGGSY